ncbi:MAG: hypothetical protein EXS38_12280 [Opitutus sp.]|nr:hypothetical protein [Opitutus sp.]
MNLYCRSSLQLIRLLAVLLLGAGRLPLVNAADEPAAAAPADHPEERAILEMDLARFYSLIAQDPDPTAKTTLLGYQREFATRANNLLKNFDSVRYDELRYDINLQCQRVARKLAPLLTPPPAPKVEARVALDVTALNPSPANKADVKAALEAVDGTLKRMEDRASSMVIGSSGRDAEIARIKRIKDRRAGLTKDFTKAAWDALVVELKTP